jgi:HPt (histidine-containing phosphotransfer) domain-containing protein
VALAGVPAIQREVGLRYFGGDDLTYNRMLAKFIELHGQDAEVMAAAFEQGRLGVVEQTAHALKGIAGSLGAVLVCALAAQVEAAARDVEQHANLPDLLPELSQAMAEAVRHIRSLKPVELPVMSAGSEASLEDLLQQLQDLLAEDDPQAEELWRDLGPRLTSEWPPAVVSELGSQIENFNFPLALQVLSGYLQPSV